MAVTNCSNSGLNLLTAWYDGMDIVYKESPNAMVFRPGQTAGVKGVGQISVSAAPNPASEHLQLSGVSQSASYQISDISGRAIQRGIIPANQQLQVNNLAKGSYLLQVKAADGNGCQTIRFTKQ